MAYVNNFLCRLKTDKVIPVLGMQVGAAFCHNFALASNAKSPTPNGKIAILVDIVLQLAISYFTMERK